MYILGHTWYSSLIKRRRRYDVWAIVKADGEVYQTYTEERWAVIQLSLMRSRKVRGSYEMKVVEL